MMPSLSSSPDNTVWQLAIQCAGAVLYLAAIYIAVWREDRAYQAGYRRGSGKGRRFWNE